MSTGNIPLNPVVTDQLITAALWNAEFANVQTLTAPEGIEGYEDTDAEMQIQTNPFPGSVTSHASSLAGEIERIRYQIAQLINGGTDFWYKLPGSNIATMQNALVPIGGTIEYPSATPPNANWHLEDGTAISRAGYPALFALIGTTFGVGDGSTTFNLPDSRDLMAIGAGNLYAVGAKGGATANTPTITTTITDPGHNHTQNSHTHSTPAHTHILAQNSTGSGIRSTGAAVIVDPNGNLYPGDGSGGSAAASATTTSGGSGTTGSTTPTNNSNTTGITAGSTSTSVPTLPPYIGKYKMIRVL